MSVKPIKLNHSVSLLTYHFVTAPKYRAEVLNDKVVEVIKEAIKNHPIQILEGNVGEKDHIHLLIQAPATYSPAQIANLIKGTSQVAFKKTLPDWRGWQVGYYISTVGGNDLETVNNYIRGQKQ